MLLVFQVAFAYRSLYRELVVFLILCVTSVSIWVSVLQGDIFAAIVLLEKGKNFLFIPAVDTFLLFVARRAKVRCWPLDFRAFRVFAGGTYRKNGTLSRVPSILQMTHLNN